MPSNSVILSLAKVLVAEAWADGVIKNEEINCLKDLLFHLPGMTAEDWAVIDIYVESPVEQAERERLVEELQIRLTSSNEKAQVLQALDQMAQADGEVSAAEQAIVNEIKAEIEAAKFGISGRWKHFTKGSVQRRSQVLLDAPNRELYLDDFVKNKIYYDVSRQLALENVKAEIPDDDLRKLSLAGGLMARVAYVDNQVIDAESQSMVQALEHWGVSPAEAALVAEVAVSEISKGLDYYRLTRQFFESTTEDERLRFLDVLFAIAASDGRASNEEMEEIRTVANGLLLTHQQFINAKLKIPREQRAN